MVERRMLSREEIIRDAIVVEWDDDEIRHAYNARCACGGLLRMITLHRNPFTDSVLSAPLPTYDVLETECFSCSAVRMFPFQPQKIHLSLEELLRRNRSWIRL